MQSKTSIQPKKNRRFQNLQGPAFILPTLAVLLVIVTYPLLYGGYISLFNTNLVNKWQFAGGKYYLSILKDKEFYESVWITLRYTAFVVAGHFILGMVLAAIINKPFRGRLLFRTILLLPWVMPDVSIALIFKWIFNPVYGIANQILQDAGLIKVPIEWFSAGSTAFFSIVFISIWKGYPLIMLLILAGLQSISENLTEAARIDGANAWQVQRYIVLPGLKPVMLSALILDTVWWFKHFTIVWITTGGGPDGATNLLSINIFKEAFDNLKFGKAAALAVLVFFICYLIGMVYRKVLDNES